MNNYIKSIVPIVEAKYDSFTNVEKNIADFFLKNQRKIDFSAQNVAKEIFVSEASLSRFAKKCGFHGYREFIYQYEKTFTQKSEIVTNSTRMVLNTYQELLNRTYSLMDEAQIARVVKYLFETERVVACGKGSSGLAASNGKSVYAGWCRYRLLAGYGSNAYAGSVFEQTKFSLWTYAERRNQRSSVSFKRGPQKGSKNSYYYRQ